MQQFRAKEFELENLLQKGINYPVDLYQIEKGQEKQNSRQHDPQQNSELLDFGEFDDVKQQKQRDQIKEQLKEEKEQEVKFIIHKVSPIDTLIGLSVQYGVPEGKIKQFNNLNGDEIYYRKELKIPNPQTNFENNYSPEDLEKNRKLFIISSFRNSVLLPADQSDQVAKFYLEEAEWDQIKAAQIYKEDLDWEKQAQKLNSNVQVNRQQVIEKIYNKNDEKKNQ